MLLLIINPSTTKWAYADGNTLTYSITRQATGEEGGEEFLLSKSRNYTREKYNATQRKKSRGGEKVRENISKCKPRDWHD